MAKIPGIHELANIKNWRNDLVWTLNNMGTNPTDFQVFYRREGNTMHVRGSYVLGTSLPAATPSISLPAGHTIDTSKFGPAGVTVLMGRGEQILAGTANINVASGTGTNVMLDWFYDGLDNTKVFPTFRITSGIHSKDNTNSTFTASRPVQFELFLPITEWT